MASVVFDEKAKTLTVLIDFNGAAALKFQATRVRIRCMTAGRLSGFTWLFEAFVLMLARQMHFAAVARIVGESLHGVLAVCQKYVEMACGLADYWEVAALAIDETSRARGHS